MSLTINQKTFQQAKPTIYLVGTPIGNRQDFAPRAQIALKQADVILAEDTRTAKKLLGTNFHQPLVSLHKFNEQHQLTKIKQWLLTGKNLAIISDAGVPLIADPGALVLETLRTELPNQFSVTAINVGPAFIHASLVTGLGTDHHYFYGFLNNRTSKQKTLELSRLLNQFHETTTIIFYESVHRILDTFKILEQLLVPDTEIAIARELTKLNEEVIRGSLNSVSSLLASDDFVLKGEFVVLISPKIHVQITWSEEKIYQQLKQFIEQGQSLKQATQIVSDLSGQSKNQIYQLYIHKKS